MLATRLAAHHCDADLATICDTELMSKHSRSDGQLPLLEPQQLLCLSSLLTLVPPHVRDERGLIRNVARPTRVWALRDLRVEEEASGRGCTEVRRRWCAEGNRGPRGMTGKLQVNR